MKHLFYIILSLAILSGCRHTDIPDEDVTEDVVDDPIKEERLKLNPDAIECGPDGGDFTIRVSSSSDWNLSDTLSWAECTRVDSETASVTILPNHGTHRQGIAIFFSFSTTDTLTIEQSQSDAFTIDRSSYLAHYDGEEFQISVTSFTPWEVTSDSDWISTDTGIYDGPRTLRVHVGANSEWSERSGQITFTRGNDTLQTHVTQSPHPFIKLRENLIKPGGDGGIYDILYLTNTTVEIYRHPEWVRIISGSMANTLSFEVLRNTSEERTGSIVLRSSEDSRVSETLEIHQEASIPHPSLTFKEGTSMTVTTQDSFALTPVFEDMTDTSLTWKSSDTEVAEVDQSGNITICSTGKSTITATNTFHDQTATMTLEVKLKATGIKILLGEQDVLTDIWACRFVGEEIPIKIIMTPEDAYSEDFVFYSSDPAVASFNGHTLICHKTGTAHIYIESIHNDIHCEFTLIVIAG